MTYHELKAKLIPLCAEFAATALCAILFICANTNSSCVFFQLERPTELDKFSKVK